jgi:hypothetical protein
VLFGVLEPGAVVLLAGAVVLLAGPPNIGGLGLYLSAINWSYK